MFRVDRLRGHPFAFANEINYLVNGFLPRATLGGLRRCIKRLQLKLQTVSGSPSTLGQSKYEETWAPSVLAPLGSAALAGLCGGGYLGAPLGPPPYLVSLRANSLAQPEGTECLSTSTACGRVLSMNQTPGEQW